MCRLFPCIPIFLLKMYMIMLKIALLLVKNLFFDEKKGISQLVS